MGLDSPAHTRRSQTGWCNVRSRVVVEGRHARCVGFVDWTSQFNSLPEFDRNPTQLIKQS